MTRPFRFSPIPELETHWRAWLDAFNATLPSVRGREELPSFEEVREAVWHGALEAVSPKEEAKRGLLRRCAGGFPWEAAGDIRLYWRLFAAAQGELAIDTSHGSLTEIHARPLSVVSGFAADALDLLALTWFREEDAETAERRLQKRLLNGLMHLAAAHINHMPHPEQPMPRRFLAGETVRYGGVTAAFVTCSTNGQAVIDRETAPPGDPTWQLDVHDGRHSLAVWPWQLTRL
jgi:hypothetical protein